MILVMREAGSVADWVNAVEFDGAVTVEGFCWRDGRKKGAFSGGLGASLGLLRARMTSRWRRFCQRDLGTRLSVVMRSLSWSIDGTTVSSSSCASTSSTSPAASMRPSPPSPEVEGASISEISLSVIWRVGACANRVRFVQMCTPTLSSCAVARYSPVLEKARAVQGLRSFMASMKWPVGRSQTRIIESDDAEIIQRPSLEKVKSMVWICE